MSLSVRKKQKITSDTKFEKPLVLFAKNRKPDAKTANRNPQQNRKIDLKMAKN